MKGVGLDVSHLLSSEDHRLETLSDMQALHGPLVAVGVEFIPLGVVQSRDSEGRMAFRGRPFCNGVIMLTWPKEATDINPKAPQITRTLVEELSDPGAIGYGNYDAGM
jgi:hypothetical protein